MRRNTIMGKKEEIKEMLECIEELREEIEEQNRVLREMMGVIGWQEMKLKEAWIKIGDEDEDKCTC